MVDNLIILNCHCMGIWCSHKGSTPDKQERIIWLAIDLLTMFHNFHVDSHKCNPTPPTRTIVSNLACINISHVLSIHRKFSPHRLPPKCQTHWTKNRACGRDKETHTRSRQQSRTWFTRQNTHFFTTSLSLVRIKPLSKFGVFIHKFDWRHCLYYYSSHCV